jgi:L-idonate 5-dehydrogenase
VRLAGAAEIVVTDLFDEALAIASRMGATEVVNVRGNASRMAVYMQDGGYFDAALEASGNPLGLETCIGATRARGRIVQVGIQPAGQSAVSMNKLIAKELDWSGHSFLTKNFDGQLMRLPTGGSTSALC